MRDPVVALYVVSVVLIAASGAVVARWRDARAAFLGVSVEIVVAALAVLGFPLNIGRHAEKADLWVYVALVVSLLLAVEPLALSKARPLDKLASFLTARPALANAALAITSAILALAAVEFTAASLTRAGIVRRYTPTETRLAEQTEDWRMAHIMSDEFREPDPVLLWRPAARSPYTSQDFRGPTVAPHKPRGTVRIICYGDSNTDGPPAGAAWPAALAEILGARPKTEADLSYEILNAGVTGY